MTHGVARGAAALMLVGAGVAAVPVAPVAARGGLSGSTARHEVYPVPPGGVYTIHGRGYGHGHGMSQWGAYGAAKVDRLSANQILHFYYPHTALATRSTSRTIRVLLTAVRASSRGYVEVRPADGLTVTPETGDPIALPTATKHGDPIAGWRLVRSGAGIDLRERVHGHWRKTAAVGAVGTFSDVDSTIPVDVSGHTVRFRGAVACEVQSGSLYAVDFVNLEQYLRGVVPDEMPASWPQPALQAQAVAARTYATRGIKHPKTSWFDVFGDTRDQAYGGVAAETGRTSKAVRHTAGEVVIDAAGHAILAQYASADGGWTVAGGAPSLPAKHDPYDGLVPNTSHAWSVSLPASRLEAAYPSIGSLQAIVITGRDGNGLWGGRVTALTLRGTRSSQGLTGSQFQFALGLRSAWFRPLPRPAAPAALHATAKRRTVTATWKPPRSVRGAAPVTGYRLRLTPGSHTQTLPASARSASVGKLAPGRYTVRLVALSDAGAGPGATVVVKTRHQ